jgi:hypothetical protein
VVYGEDPLSYRIQNCTVCPRHQPLYTPLSAPDIHAFRNSSVVNNLAYCNNERGRVPGRNDANPTICTS